MTMKEKLALIEDCMDLETGTLNPEDEVEKFEEWDSVTILSLIAVIDDHFHRILSGQDLRKVKTIADVLAFME